MSKLFDIVSSFHCYNTTIPSAVTFEGIAVKEENRQEFLKFLQKGKGNVKKFLTINDFEKLMRNHSDKVNKLIPNFGQIPENNEYFEINYFKNLTGTGDPEYFAKLDTETQKRTMFLHWIDLLKNYNSLNLLSSTDILANKETFNLPAELPLKIKDELCIIFYNNYLNKNKYREINNFNARISCCYFNLTNYHNLPYKLFSKEVNSDDGDELKNVNFVYNYIKKNGLKGSLYKKTGFGVKFNDDYYEGAPENFGEKPNIHYLALLIKNWAIISEKPNLLVNYYLFCFGFIDFSEIFYFTDIASFLTSGIYILSTGPALNDLAENFVEEYDEKNTVYLKYKILTSTSENEYRINLEKYEKYEEFDKKLGDKKSTIFVEDPFLLPKIIYFIDDKQYITRYKNIKKIQMMEKIKDNIFLMTPGFFALEEDYDFDISSVVSKYKKLVLAINNFYSQEINIDKPNLEKNYYIISDIKEYVISKKKNDPVFIGEIINYRVSIAIEHLKNQLSNACYKYEDYFQVFENISNQFDCLDGYHKKSFKKFEKATKTLSKYLQKVLRIQKNYINQLGAIYSGTVFPASPEFNEVLVDIFCLREYYKFIIECYVSFKLEPKNYLYYFLRNFEDKGFIKKIIKSSRKIENIKNYFAWDVISLSLIL